MKIRMLTRTRLLAGFLMVAIVGAGVGGLGVFAMHSMARQMEQAMAETTAPLKDVFNLYASFLRVQLEIRDLFLKDSQELEDTIAGLNKAGAAIQAQANDLLARSNDETVKSTLGAFPSVWRDFSSNLDSLYSEARKGRGKADPTFMYSLMGPAESIVESVMGMVVDAYMGQATEMQANGKRLADTATIELIAFSALGFGISIGLGLFVATQISRPLVAASRLAASIASGNLGGGRMGRRDVSRLDEVGDLARALEVMVHDLNEGFGGIGSSVGSLRAVGGDLSESLVRMNGAVSQIGTDIERVRKETEEQSAGVEETAATVMQMARTIEGLDEEIAAQAEGITDSSKSVAGLVSSIDEVGGSVGRLGADFARLLSSADDGRAKLENVTSIVEGIAAQSERLEEANKTVSGIASRTNLLAMNAAIEAAHAGDSGKGFAVVADEIRSLAESAAEQSREINSDIASIRGAIDEAVAGAEVAREAFGSVQELISSLGQLERTINEALESQRAESSRILDGLSSIRRGSDRVLEGSKELKAGSGAIGGEMGELRETMLALKSAVDGIAQEVTAIAESARSVDDLSAANGDAISAVESLISRYRLADRDGAEEGSGDPGVQ